MYDSRLISGGGAGGFGPRIELGQRGRKVAVIEGNETPRRIPKGKTYPKDRGAYGCMGRGGQRSETRQAILRVSTWGLTALMGL